MRDSMIFPQQPEHPLLGGGQHRRHAGTDAADGGLRKQWDPHGGASGTRDNDRRTARRSRRCPNIYGVMIGQAPRRHHHQPGEIFRGYSVERRDKAPLIETEDFRDEAARGIWDDYSPPHFGFKPKGGPVAATPSRRQTPTIGTPRPSASPPPPLHQLCRNRIDNPDPAHSKWSAYASIYFTDSDADGRQDGSEVLRVSGKVDGVRLPKEMFFVSRVMQSDTPDLHIIGHWTYPANTVKTVYVAASHCDQVELFLNGHPSACKAVNTFNGGRTKHGQHRLHLRLPEHRLRARHAQGRRDQGRPGRRPAGTQDRRRTQGPQAHRPHRPERPAGRRLRRGPGGL
jgi:hypothetical protein